MERTLFMLGNHPALSLAELAAVAQRSGKPWQPINVDTVFVIVPWGEDEGRAIFQQTGGLVRSAVVFSEGGQAVDPMPVMAKHLMQRRGRIVFGVSGLGKGGPSLHAIQNLGLKAKEMMVEQGRAVRFVFGREAVLSAASVTKNHLIHRGEEIIIARQGNAWWLAQTAAVQPYDDFARRDLGRPSRDMKSGTMPPKLARLLVNLASVPLDGVLLDPFLGSGTVIQEAMLLGYRQLVGSDTSASAVEMAKQNLTWLEREKKLPKSCRTIVSSVEQLPSKLPPESVHGIATEPYLGPAMSRDAAANRRSHLVQDLDARYLAMFSSFSRILRPGARAAVVFPVFARRDPQGFLPGLDVITKMGFRIVPPLTADLQDRFKTELSFRQTLLYHREGQHVWREIIIFEKK